MSALNIAGIVFLACVLVLSFLIKLYTRRKLKDLDGVGAIHKQDSEEDKGIYL